MRFTALSILLFLVLVSVSFAQTPVGQCQLINTPGSYVVTNPLSGQPVPYNTRDNCIVITVSDVELDCLNNRITATNSTNSTGILVSSQVPLDNITIRNCNVSGYEGGVMVNYLGPVPVSNSTFDNLDLWNNGFGFTIVAGNGNNYYSNIHAHSNSINGISIIGESTGYLLNISAHDNSRDGIATFQALLGMMNVTANSNGQQGFNLSLTGFQALDVYSYDNGENGIFMKNSQGILTDIESHDNGENGIFMNGSQNSQFKGGKVYSNGLSGFNVSDTSHYNLIYNFDVYNNSVDGILISGNLGNMLSNNEVFLNGDGIIVQFAHNVSLYQNDVHDNNQYGVGIQRTYNTTTIQNEIHDNSIAGMYLFAYVGTIFGFPPTIVTSQQDHFYDNGEDLVVQDSSTIIPGLLLQMNNSIFDNPAGDYKDFTNLTIYDMSELGTWYSVDWTGSPGGYPPTYFDFKNTMVSIVNYTPVWIDYIQWSWSDPYAASGYIEDYFQLWKHNGSVWTLLNNTPDTTFNTLARWNVSSFSTFGILTNVSNCPVITVPGGYAMANNFVGQPNLIVPSSTTVACVIINTSNVYFDCNGYSITGNTPGTTPSSYGVYVNGSASSRYTNVTLVNCPSIWNYTYGVGYHYTDYSIIRNVTAHDNDDDGFELYDADFNNVTNNTAQSNAAWGFHLYGGASDNNLTDNIADDNLDAFILSTSCNYNIFVTNTARDSTRHGFYIIGSDYNTFWDNEVYDNTEHGFFFAPGSDNNNLTLNTIRDNGLDGVHAQNAANNYYDNVAYGNRHGFVMNGTTGSLLYLNTAHDNTFGFLLLQSSGVNLTDNSGYFNTVGLFMDDSDNGNDIYTNKFYNSTSDGVYSVDSDFNTFDGNEVYDNGREGIRLTNSTENFLNGNDVHDNTDAGIGLILASNTNTVTYNDLYWNRIGLGIDSSSGNVLNGNDVYENTQIGVLFVNSNLTTTNNNEIHNQDVVPGLYIQYSNQTTLNSDHFYDNGPDMVVNGSGHILDMNSVIFDRDAGDYTNFTNLSIYDNINSAYSIEWDQLTPSFPPHLRSFEGKYVEITNLTAGVSIDNATWHWTALEASGYEEGLLQLWDYDGAWTLLNDSSDTVTHTLSLFNLDSFSTFAILENTGCPAPITTPGVYQLKGNVKGAPNPLNPGNTACVLITSDDVLFDCQGYSITNNGTAPVTHGFGVKNAENVTIINCPSISQYNYGITFIDVNDSFILNSTAHSNGNSGFWLTTAGGGGSQRNTVENNTVHNNTGNGMYILASDNNFTNNTAYNNSYGFYLSQSNAFGNMVVDNTARNNLQDGFILFDTGSNNVLENNTAFGNGQNGFLVSTGSDDNDLINNTAYDNSRGFRISSCNGTFALDNTAHNNNLDGFLVEESFSSKLQTNLAYENLEGYHMTDSSAWTLHNNTAENNTRNGFLIENSSDLFMPENTAYNNGWNGMLLTNNTSDSDLLNNTYTFNGYSGFVANQSHDLYLEDNVAYNNTASGFEFIGSYDNGLVDNTAYLNGMDGFLFHSASNDNNITLSTAYLNGGNGFYANNCAAMRFISNTAYLNSQNGMGMQNSAFSYLFDSTAYLNAGSGFYLQDSGFIFLFNDESYLNDGQGFFLNDTGTVFVSFSEAYLNNATGYLAYDSGGVIFEENTGHSNYPAAFVALESSNIEYYNNTAYNDTGFLMWNTTDILLEWNTAANCSDSEINATFPFLIDDSGFVLVNTNDSYLYNNTAYNYTAHPIPDDPNSFGFILHDSNNNELIDNTAYLNNDSGFGLWNSNNNFLMNLEGYNNRQAGIKFAGGVCEFNTLVDSVFYGNRDLGVYLEGANNNTVMNNLAYDSDLAFALTGSLQNNLTGNTAYNASGFVMYYAAFNHLENNTAANTSSSQISAYFPILDDSGFVLLLALNNTLVNNTAYNFTGGDIATGFFLGLAANNTLAGNLAYDNTGNGFVLTLNSTSNTLVNNTAYNNTDGFSAEQNASDNLFENNTARDNIRGGFGVYEAFNNRLVTNEIFRNEYGVGIRDSNLTYMTSDHLFNNSNFDVGSINSIGSYMEFIINLTTVLFDNPYGNLTNFTNLSLYDVHEPNTAYLLKWATEPAGGLPPERTSFEQKYINITRRNASENVSLDHVVWHWRDDEVLGYSEHLLDLYEYNGSNWIVRNNTPDTAMNTLSLHGAEDFNSIFAILEYTPDEGGDDDFGGGLTVRVTTNCSGNFVEVLDGGDPVDEADVTVTNQDTLAIVATGQTNASGEFVFYGCSYEAKVYANKGGYTSTTVFKDLVNCEFCEIECVEDYECEDNEYCEGYECVPVECDCGQVSNHTCHEFGCCSDADCLEGQDCIDNSCVWQCTSDEECADDEYCRILEGDTGGRCDQVEGDCGYPENHTWVQYECGDEENCSECAEGLVCVEHVCLPAELDCPEEVVLGTEENCMAGTDEEPCADCEYVIRDPTGKEFFGRTGPDGSIALPFQYEGTHTVGLTKDGQLIAEVEVEALPKSPPVEPEKPTQEGLDAFTLLWLLILLLLLILFFVYWRSRKQKKVKK